MKTEIIVRAEAVLAWEALSFPFELDDDTAIVGGSLVEVLRWAMDSTHKPVIRDFDIATMNPERVHELIKAAGGYIDQRSSSRKHAAAFPSLILDGRKFDILGQLADSVEATTARFDITALHMWFDGNLIFGELFDHAEFALGKTTATRSLLHHRHKKFTARGWDITEMYPRVPEGVIPPDVFSFGVADERDFTRWQKLTGWEPAKQTVDGETP